MIAIWQFVKPHLVYWIVGAVCLLAFKSWLTEHDKNLVISAKVDGLQATVDSQKTLIEQLRSSTQKQVQVVRTVVKEAKTHDQQIAAIPQLSTQPLNPQSLPDAPSAVKVELAPLVAQLGKCKEDAISLGACQQEIAYRDKIETAQGQQVDLLKRKRTFWQAFGQKAKQVAPCGIAGAVLGATAKGNKPQNVAFGAGLGIAACGFVFK